VATFGSPCRSVFYSFELLRRRSWRSWSCREERQRPRPHSAGDLGQLRTCAPFPFTRAPRTKERKLVIMTLGPSAGADGTRWHFRRVPRVVKAAPQPGRGGRRGPQMPRRAIFGATLKVPSAVWKGLALPEELPGNIFEGFIAHKFQIEVIE
jgi:hypothetical protein